MFNLAQPMGWDLIVGLFYCSVISIGPPGWGLGAEVTNQHRKKVIVTKPQFFYGRPGHDLGCRAI
jgi:hypothetical protein